MTTTFGVITLAARHSAPGGGGLVLHPGALFQEFRFFFIRKLSSNIELGLGCALTLMSSHLRLVYKGNGV